MSAFDELLDNLSKSSDTVGGIEVLSKAIPTVSKQKPVPIVEQSKVKKEVPAEVKAYLKKLENCFDTLDEAVKDLVALRGVTQTADLAKAYGDFKSNFRWKMNDAINYGKQEEYKTSADSDWDATRLKVKDI